MTRRRSQTVHLPFISFNVSLYDRQTLATADEASSKSHLYLQAETSAESTSEHTSP